MARKAPTARQRRIGVELRRMRESAGLSIAEGAALLGTDRTNISNIESGRFGVSGERVRQLATNYDCPDTAYVEALATMAEMRLKGWWEEYRGILSASVIDLAELEYHATRLTYADAVHIPGLLQTEEHARGLLRLDLPTPSDVDLQRRVSHRMKRKTVLERDSPTPCLFYIHEAALQMRLAGVDVQRRQLDRILELSEHEHITVRAIPFAADGYAGAGSGISYAFGQVAQLDTAGADSPVGVHLMDGPAQLARYRATLEDMNRVALPPRRSRDFILLTKRKL